MSEEKILEESLSGAIIKLTDTVSSVDGFVLEKSPEILQQLISFQILQNSIFLGISLMVFLGVLSMLFFKAGRDVFENEDYNTLLITLVVLGFLGVLFFSYNILKLLLAPSVYILEYASTLIN